VRACSVPYYTLLTFLKTAAELESTNRGIGSFGQSVENIKKRLRLPNEKPVIGERSNCSGRNAVGVRGTSSPRSAAKSRGDEVHRPSLHNDEPEPSALGMPRFLQRNRLLHSRRLLLGKIQG
jgi:hypothetical protein